MREKRLSEKKFKAALVKKALGYDATEVVEEYVSDEAGGGKTFQKKGHEKERAARYVRA